MKVPPPPLLPLLRSQVAGNLLALLYLNPEQEYSLSQVARLIGSNLNTLHYEVSRMYEAGLIRERRQGNLRLIRSVPDSLLTRPLTDLLAVTYGPLPVISALIREVEGVEEAYIYGSWAARYRGEPGPIPADVDVLVIGNVDLDRIDDIAEQAQRRLRRSVSIRRVLPATWRASDPADPFLTSVKTRPLVTLLPGEADPAQRPEANQ